ncbi:MAG TPA: rhomboid family intramembrane serine protease [Verrucomicrobiae bacterium]|nr:rhomboid family intramembrane serine protease [Verrucomicrobiae bacterium]
MDTPATIAVLVITGLVTFVAFQKPGLLEKLMLNPQAILADKEYYRLYSSGFIHANWMHFTFNAFSFYSFAATIEHRYGPSVMLLIYGCSILGGSLLSLIIHRNHEYRALGASGGVCGIIFASIFLLPHISINMFFIPIGIPAYLYAVVFLVGSFFAHRRQLGNIGHDAHLGGAIVGLLVAAGLYPDKIAAAPGMFALVMGLSVAILLAMIFLPHYAADRRFGRKPEFTGDEREKRYQENASLNDKKAELDALLDKIARQGMGSLSEGERERMERLSKELYR